MASGRSSRGDEDGESNMLRFVILRHELPPGDPRGTHFDLMLEHSGLLRTWAMSVLPTPGQTVPAVRLPDHRLFYLDYEGEVSGNRGRVSRWDAGEYDWDRAAANAEEADSTWHVILRGQKLAGLFHLARSPATTTDAASHVAKADPVKGDTANNGEPWTVTWQHCDRD